MANEDAVLAWAGKTADVFTAEFEDVPGKLKKLKLSVIVLRQRQGAAERHRCGRSAA